MLAVVLAKMKADTVEPTMLELAVGTTISITKL
jgi:hypothetical protein